MNTAVTSKRHYVDPAPFDPGKTEPVGAENESFYRASSWQLMWWKFRRHRVAVAAAFILLAFYALVPFVEVIAPYNQTKRHGDFLYAPPQAVHLMHEGRFIGPYVYPYTYSFDLESFRRVYTVDTSKPQPIRFFCRGDAYEFWGLWQMDVHLFCPPEDGTMFLLGTDGSGATCSRASSTGRGSRSPSASSASRSPSPWVSSSAASRAISAAGSIT